MTDIEHGFQNSKTCEKCFVAQNKSQVSQVNNPTQYVHVCMCIH